MSARSLAAALALSTLSAATARAAPTVPPARPPAAPVAAGERIEIVGRRPAFLRTGTFRVTTASGSIHDQGEARDLPNTEAPDSPVDRLLEGERGTIRLRVEGGHKAAPFPAMHFGRWRIVDATGAYAGLRGEGTYTVTDGGAPDAKSVEVEMHWLVGVVRRTGP
jgi:hypothetical protein